MGWRWDATARPEVRRRLAPSNFAATLERIPIAISGLEIMTSASINKFLKVDYDFWNIIPHFRMAHDKGKEGLGAGNLREESLAANDGGQDFGADR
jgi:hypothetical protein